MLAARSLSRLSTKSTATLRPISRQLTPLARRLPSVLPGGGSIGVRAAASQVSNRPGSQSIPHAAQNIKEEVGHAIEDMAQTIAGGKPAALGPASADDSSAGGFVGITSAVASSVPSHIMGFGLAGGLPYIGTSAFTIYLANQAGQAASGATSTIDPGVAMSLLDQAMNVQVTYGAVMLGFLGALHWGLEIAEYGGSKGSKRLMLGMAPVIVGWGTLALDPSMALVTQWAGFTGLWYADMKATAAGWTPQWYSQYRFYLSLLVGTCIIGTLAGTSFLGPTQSHSATLRELHMLREQRAKRSLAEREKPVAPGEIGSVSGIEEGADAYVLVKHAPEPKEEKKKKEDK
ncbi:hypothetical protein M408DRAFT_19629 [Serendipita vermifera MAFF 305830]|uniref:Uncharacterized protein n=1 Tax=Serendipita vermifera MAFF 305830 TaxID=933852 RepID=A0A0C2XWR7_SERVB|nr:hypothetical protein M408DRAFT_19629 [Serendipita vermifera MAFF 305830]